MENLCPKWRICSQSTCRKHSAILSTLLVRNPAVMKTDHVRVSGFFSFVNLEYRLNLSAHVTILLTSQQGFWQGEWDYKHRCLLLGSGSRALVNAFILFSTKVQLISIFSYWISNLGNHHHRWFGVDNVHIPCKYIILTNLICFYCYLVKDRQFLLHLWHQSC
jgi:hypothetical protein